MDNELLQLITMARRACISEDMKSIPEVKGLLRYAEWRMLLITRNPWGDLGKTTDEIHILREIAKAKVLLTVAKEFKDRLEVDQLLSNLQTKLFWLVG